MSDVYRRCGCRDEDGKQLGARCPKLSDSKHGTWGYHISAGTDPLTGKRRTVREFRFTREADARKARNAAAVKIDIGTYVTPSKQTYSDYLDMWFKRRQTTGDGLKPTTADNYARYIRKDIQPTSLGRMKLTDIRRHHINSFLDDLTASGRGATTVHRIAAVVQGSLKAAAHDDMIDHNPGIGIRLPIVEAKEVAIWEPEQVGQFLDIATKHRLGAMFEVAMFTGLRRGELIGLRWKDLDLSRRVLSVRNNRTNAGTQIVEYTPKTAAGRRTLDVDDNVAGVLISWKLKQQQEADAWGESWTDSGYVFTYENGEPLKPQYATRLFDKLRVQASLPKLTFHGQRHEAASLMLASETDIAVVSKMLGHSSLGITSDIYGHLIGSASRSAAERAAALVPRSRGGVPTLFSQAGFAGKEKAPDHARSA